MKDPLPFLRTQIETDLAVAEAVGASVAARPSLSADRLAIGEALRGLGWFAAIADDDATPFEPVLGATLDESLHELAHRIDRWLEARLQFGAESAATRRWAERRRTHGSILDYLREVAATHS